jgi:hypothetical protein
MLGLCCILLTSITPSSIRRLGPQLFYSASANTPAEGLIHFYAETLISNRSKPPEIAKIVSTQATLFDIVELTAKATCSVAICNTISNYLSLHSVSYARKVTSKAFSNLFPHLSNRYGYYQHRRILGGTARELKFIGDNPSDITFSIPSITVRLIEFATMREMTFSFAYSHDDYEPAIPLTVEYCPTDITWFPPISHDGEKDINEFAKAIAKEVADHYNEQLTIPSQYHALVSFPNPFNLLEIPENFCYHIYFCFSPVCFSAPTLQTVVVSHDILELSIIPPLQVFPSTRLLLLQKTSVLQVLRIPIILNRYR